MILAIKKNERLERGRYRRENDKIIIDVAVKNSRQLFNERDPAPFRERDLDEHFATYILSSVQEFPLKTAMKIRIVIGEASDHSIEQAVIREAIRSHFDYESRLSQTNLRKRLRVGRWFFLIGLATLFACLSMAEFLRSFQPGAKLWAIAREGFVIIGWVAMWRPVEVFLYDWWPLREQKLYLAKIAETEVEVVLE